MTDRYDEERFRQDYLVTEPGHWLDVMHHDNPERHTFGRTFLEPGIPLGDSSVASAGVSQTPSREDHVHSAPFTQLANPDLSFGGVGYSRQNATSDSKYRFVDGEFEWVGWYKLGSLTAFPAQIIFISAAVHGITANPDGIYVGGGIQTVSVGSVMAVDSSAGQIFNDFVSIGNTDQCRFFSNVRPAAFYTNLVPFTWAVNDVFGWNIRYKIV